MQNDSHENKKKLISTIFTWEKSVCSLSLAFYDFGPFIFRFGCGEKQQQKKKNKEKPEVPQVFLSTHVYWCIAKVVCITC